MHVLLLTCIMLAGMTTVPAHAQENMEARKAKATAAAEEIITMRSNLAKNFIKPGAEITEGTFNNVCGAVGKRVKEIMATEGFTIRHASRKYRNPANAPKPDEMEGLDNFEKFPNLHYLWDEVVIEKKKYHRLYRPILVEEACLACHGPKEKRPRFIVEKYPEDKAYDFKVGDFRGLIMVLVKEKE